MNTEKRKLQFKKGSNKWRKANPDKVKLIGLRYREGKKSKIEQWKKTYVDIGLQKTCKSCTLTKDINEFPKTGWSHGIRVYRPSCKICLYPSIRKRKNQLRKFVPYDPKSKVYQQTIRKQLRDCYIKSLIVSKAKRIQLRIYPSRIPENLIKCQRRILKGLRKINNKQSTKNQ